MLRFLIEILTVVYLVYLIRGAYRRFMAGPEPSPGGREARRSAPPADDPLTLVRCARCGVHVPRSRARGTTDNGRPLCDGCSAGGAGA